jgi:glycine betaine catabolism A
MGRNDRPRFRMDPAGQFRITSSSLSVDAVSYTISGGPALRRRLSDDASTDQPGTLKLFHYPTAWKHVLSDHAVTFRVLPLSATETALTTKWLVHKDARVDRNRQSRPQDRGGKRSRHPLSSMGA